MISWKKNWPSAKKNLPENDFVDVLFDGYAING